ncbi:MAG: Gfo/Idh/MocA family oxidoreductase [Ignavibacteriales bacterium]|nr:Gfo/Idh/MocA family oxidoreductase [Ignavibacteriales bacterium]
MERKEFLIKSTILAAGIGAGIVGCRKENEIPIPLNDQARIKIGIIGLGDRGSTIIGVLNHSPEFKIIACCDILDFRLERGVKNIKEKVTGYNDYRKMLENKDLEAVIISTPLHEHYSMAMDALDANLHIMCEKVMAYNIEQSQAIKKKAEQSSKMFQVSYQYQLNPTFNAIKDIIHNGYCGKITRIDAHWHRNSNWRREIPSPELEKQINWRMYKEYSGGLMAELGSHHLNMIDNILGQHPIKVVGTGGIDYWQDGREIYDNVYALFDYPNGVKASFSSLLSNRYEDQIIKFYGDKATIVSNKMNEAYIYPEEGADKEWDEKIDGMTSASIKIIDEDQKRNITPKNIGNENYPFEDNYRNTTWLLYKNFSAAIKGEEKLKLGLHDGYQSSISVHIANKAIREESVQKWKPEYDI